MHRTTLVITALLTPTLALADPPADAPVREEEPAGVDEKKPKDDPKGEPTPRPLVLPELLPPPAGLDQAEAFNRRASAYVSIGVGVPLILLGAAGLIQSSQEQQNLRTRNQLAREGGATIAGGTGLIIQGAAALRAEEQRKKREAAAKRRREQLLSPPTGFDPLMLSLEQDAERARKARDTAGTLMMVGGLLVGGVLGALPFASDAVDRVTFVSAGVGVMAAGVGAGAWHWLTPSREEEVYEQAKRAR